MSDVLIDYRELALQLVNATYQRSLIHDLKSAIAQPSNWEVSALIVKADCPVDKPLAIVDGWEPFGVEGHETMSIIWLRRPREVAP